MWAWALYRAVTSRRPVDPTVLLGDSVIWEGSWPGVKLATSLPCMLLSTETGLT